MSQLWPSFPDVPDSHWCAKTIRFAAALGIIGGFPDGTFRPDENITRAQTVSVTMRALRVAVVVSGITALGAYLGATYRRKK